jgi:hypothetical protein
MAIFRIWTRYLTCGEWHFEWQALRSRRWLPGISPTAQRLERVLFGEGVRGGDSRDHLAAKQLAAVVLTKVAKPGSNPNRSLNRACNSGSWPGRTRRDRRPESCCRRQVSNRARRST